MDFARPPRKFMKDQVVPVMIEDAGEPAEVLEPLRARELHKPGRTDLV